LIKTTLQTGKIIREKINRNSGNEQDGKVEFDTTFQHFVEDAARRALMVAMELEVNKAMRQIL